jgi:hypothetical protein
MWRCPIDVRSEQLTDNVVNDFDKLLDSVAKTYTPNSGMLQTDPDFRAEALELWETNKTGTFRNYLLNKSTSNPWRRPLYRVSQQRGFPAT